MTIGTIFNHRTGRLIPCGDAKIYIEEIGNPDLPVLLMLHGGFGTIEDFNGFAAAVLGMWTDLSPDGHPGALMGQINNEMLIIRGDNDPLTTLDSMAKLRAVAKNMSFFNIPFAEHVAFDDAPEMFLQALGQFFSMPL